MDKKKKITIILLIVMLSILLSGWVVVEAVKSADNRQRELIQQLYLEADNFIQEVINSYCNGEPQKILEFIDNDGDYPAGDFILPEGLALEYVDKHIGGKMWSAKHPSRVHANYVIKYRVAGNIPNNLGDNIKPENLVIADDESVFLIQKASVEVDKNYGQTLILVAYSQSEW